MYTHIVFYFFVDIMKPTYLYIKEHSKTGLKYFGKTTKSDPTVYDGSGKLVQGITQGLESAKNWHINTPIGGL